MSDVARYKKILADVLERRPSGTRQRLAAALGKNRSFISQIANPSYEVPVPAEHIETIFSVCHFSAAERTAFRSAFALAHPRRTRTAATRPARLVQLPDLGDDALNAKLAALVAEFMRQAKMLIEEGNTR